MGRFTRELEQADTLLPVNEHPAVRAVDTKIREAEAALSAALTHAANFKQGEMTLSAVTANEAVEKARQALKDARAEREPILAAARASAGEARLPREHALRLAQYRKAGELGEATTALVDYIQESITLGALPLTEQAVFFGNLASGPLQENLLDLLRADLVARGIEVD